MKKVRILNDYRVIFKPNHHRAMKNKCWDGYVYEHIYFAEHSLGRKISETEVVHHLDGNRSNNRCDNLLVLERSQHGKLHHWIDIGFPYKNLNEENLRIPSFCKVCEITLQIDQEQYCSNDCRAFDTRKVERPSKEQLKEDINNMSWLAIGRKYKVSNNAAKKWAKKYELL